MAKTLLLLRHAKSSRDDPDLADFDRPLADRGRRDAPRMGRWMRQSGQSPELVLCSDARRARETWSALSETLGSPAPVLFERGLYMARAKAILRRLQRLAGTVGSVLVIGHNPGLEEAALDLADGAGEPYARLRRKFPTCALARLEFAAETWDRLQPGSARLTLFKTTADLE